MKRFFFIVFLILLQNVQAAENVPSVYVDAQHSYTLSFPSEWKTLNEEAKRKIRPADISNTSQIFIREPGPAQLYLNHYQNDHIRAQLFRDILEYEHTHTDDVPDYEKFIKRFQADFGLVVETITVEPSGRSILFECSRSSSSGGRQIDLVFWNPLAEGLVELYFTSLTQEQTRNEATPILSSFKATASQTESTIGVSKQGNTINSINGIKNTPVTVAISYIANPVTWIALAVLIGLWLVFKFLVRRF